MIAGVVFGASDEESLTEDMILVAQGVIQTLAANSEAVGSSKSQTLETKLLRFWCLGKQKMGKPVALREF